MKAVLSILPFVLAGCVSSAPMATGIEWNPPARYDRAFPGKLAVQYMPQPLLADVCAMLFQRYNVQSPLPPNLRGCSVITGPNECLVVVMDRPNFGSTPAAVLRHEIGHCAGWPAHHPA